MQISIQDIRKLQKLARISLDKNKEESFLKDIGNIVNMLEQLQEFEVDDVNQDFFMGKTMHTNTGVDNFSDSKALLDNAKHEKINNSVVIKSVLS